MGFEGPDVRAALASDLAALEDVHTGAMRDLVTGFVGELRDQVEAAGLGRRLANTWRGQAYPRSGSSLTPGGYAWTKAPDIISAFARGATIYPTGGRRYLAIPTKNTPLKGRGRRMTPLDVEVAFNQDLIIRPSGRPGHLLAFVNVVGARSGRGFRQATARRQAQGRGPRLVLMFTLAPLVRIAKRLDPDAAFERWAGRFDDLAQTRWNASPLGRNA